MVVLFWEPLIFLIHVLLLPRPDFFRLVESIQRLPEVSLSHIIVFFQRLNSRHNGLQLLLLLSSYQWGLEFVRGAFRLDVVYDIQSPFVGSVFACPIRWDHRWAQRLYGLCWILNVAKVTNHHRLWGFHPAFQFLIANAFLSSLVKCFELTHLRWKITWDCLSLKRNVMVSISPRIVRDIWNMDWLESVNTSYHMRVLNMIVVLRLNGLIELILKSDLLLL